MVRAMLWLYIAAIVERGAGNRRLCRTYERGCVKRPSGQNWPCFKTANRWARDSVYERMARRLSCPPAGGRSRV